MKVTGTRGGWARRCLATALACAAVLAGERPVSAAPPRVLSLNLCGDQLLASLADREQILGLSPYARGASSSVAEQARSLPVASGGAEEVIARRPDLVLAGGFTNRTTAALLKAKGLRLVELDVVRSVEDAKEQIRRVAGLVGHPERGEIAIGRIDAALARAHAAGAERRGGRVLPLQRRGWVDAGDTLVGSLIEAVGWRNAGADIGGRVVDLETIVALSPDRLLVSEEGGRADDQGRALLEHPALRRLHRGRPPLVLPARLTVCGGPMIAEALDRLVDQLAEP